MTRLMTMSALLLSTACLEVKTDDTSSEPSSEASVEPSNEASGEPSSDTGVEEPAMQAMINWDGDSALLTLDLQAMTASSTLEWPKQKAHTQAHWMQKMLVHGLQKTAQDSLSKETTVMRFLHPLKDMHTWSLSMVPSTISPQLAIHSTLCSMQSLLATE